MALAVEGKVGESFDKPVDEWLADPRGNRANRQVRLAGLAKPLGLEVVGLNDISYQLLHRTAAALLEAERLHAPHAVLLVHSFSAEGAHLDKYRAFARLLGASGEPDTVEPAGVRHGVDLHLCWVADRARAQAHQGEPEPVLLEALDWLRDTYREHRFFKERDVEAALQRRMTELFEERRSDWRVYESHRVPGKQLDLAVVDRRRPGAVALGIELKYEPDHARGGADMRGDTAKFPVCLPEEIARDVEQVERCVSEGLIEVGYALVLDEAGYWRTRRSPPGHSGSRGTVCGTASTRWSGRTANRTDYLLIRPEPETNKPSDATSTYSACGRLYRCRDPLHGLLTPAILENIARKGDEPQREVGPRDPSVAGVGERARRPRVRVAVRNRSSRPLRFMAAP